MDRPPADVFNAIVARVGVVDGRPPATAVELDDAEAAVGHPMPLLLRRLYGELANGGFGPGYSLYSVKRSIELFEARKSLLGDVPDSLVAVCDWGCAIESYIDWADPHGQLWGFDPNVTGEFELSLHKQNLKLVDWFGLWLDDRLYQPLVGQDPATGEWRCATNDETEAALQEQ